MLNNNMTNVWEYAHQGWVSPTEYANIKTTVDYIRDQPCAIQEFFKNHPNATCVMMTCAKCTPRCM